MKKLLYLLLLLPLAFMASCSDDDDTPNVQITVTFENAAMGSDNVMYAVQEKDYPFKVQSITVKPLSGKAAGLSMVGYSLDYEPLGVAAVEPFGVNLGSLPLGNHLLMMNFSILQVDKSIFQSQLQFYFKVVEKASDIPGQPELGTVTSSFSLEPKKK